MFFFALQLEFCDILAINPELFTTPSVDVKESLPVRDNVTTQVSDSEIIPLAFASTSKFPGLLDF